MITAFSKGVSTIVSFVIYVAIVIFALSLVVIQLGPVIENIQDGFAIKNSEILLREFDSKIRSVSLGPGSSSTLDLLFDRGKFVFDPELNTFYYDIYTEKEILSSSLNTSLGDLNYVSSGNTAQISLLYNFSRVNLTGSSFEIFPGQRSILLSNRGLQNDVLTIEVKG